MNLSLASLGSTRVIEGPHQHSPAAGVVDVGQPIGPIYPGRSIHESAHATRSKRLLKADGQPRRQ